MSSIQSIPSMIHVLTKLSGSCAGSGGSLYPYPKVVVGWGGGLGGGGGSGSAAPYD